MSLYFADRVKEQKADDRGSDKNIVFTKPWIINFPIQNQNPDEMHNEEAAAETSFKTSYKMASTSWNIWLKNDFTAIIIRDACYHKWKGDCFISYTLYYDNEMRFEYFSSTRIQMDEIFTEYGYGKFQTPEGYMTRFIGGMNKKKFSKCVIFVELHLPTKYFLQPSLKTSYGAELSDKLPDDYETDFRFEFLKNRYVF
uniref:Uncharacterized protein n=1 Tax=Panagrolaimus sp. ES5 TaxID=591445 RepID=A0AC34G9W2_9BILA